MQWNTSTNLSITVGSEPTANQNTNNALWLYYKVVQRRRKIISRTTVMRQCTGHALRTKENTFVVSFCYGATFTRLFTSETPKNTWMNQPLGASVRDILNVPFDNSFPIPFVYFNSWSPYPFIDLASVKGTPFGWSLPVQSIIGSAPPSPPTRV